MKKQNIAAVVRGLIEPTVCALGYRIWDVEYSKSGADWHLCVTIDSDAGITIDDCEGVHRAIDPLLDEADPIPNFYYLEVSSPGIERELRTEEHIRRSLGEFCEARLFTATPDGRKVLSGTLVGYADGTVHLMTEEGECILPRSAIAKLKTLYTEAQAASDADREPDETNTERTEHT